MSGAGSSAGSCCPTSVAVHTLWFSHSRAGAEQHVNAGVWSCVGHHSSGTRLLCPWGVSADHLTGGGKEAGTTLALWKPYT